jgi:hypothetical protein
MLRGSDLGFVSDLLRICRRKKEVAIGVMRWRCLRRYSIENRLTNRKAGHMEFMEKKGWRGAGILALALLFASGIALGQAQTGNIYGRATDEQGGALPGVSVTLKGVSAPLTQVTNVNGEVRFLNLSPATYELEFSLQGFQKINRKNVVAAVGKNTEIDVKMKLSGVQESIVVAGESPLLDTRKTGTQTTVDKVEMNSVPTARDPWAVLQTTAGVMVDRVNVGGSESGQQSQYVAKGSSNTQGTWNIDGINVTDMAATGGSPIYFDYDSIAELNFATGGSDASVMTPGVQLNMVTKRGTNDVHGSARAFYETKKWSASNAPDELLHQAAGAGSGNSVDQLQDYGVELGGPVLKDYLWLWGSYGRQQIDLLTATGISDKTTLTDYSFKMNAQPIPENSFNAVYTYADKAKTGRNASFFRPAETTWTQAGPTKIYKIEDSHVFSSDVFATVNYSRLVGGFSLISPGQGQRYQDSDGVYHNSYAAIVYQRPQTQISALPSFFLRTGSMGHEIKVGFTYRHTPYSGETQVPTGIVGVAADNYGTPYDLAGFARNFVSQTDVKTYSGFISDTMTISKLTIQAGVRYDYQWGQKPITTIPCCGYDSSVWPQLPMTALTVPATDPLIWKDFQPRIGLTYAAGDDGKTVLKGSYARFVNMMGGNSSPIGVNAAGGVAGVTYLYYPWTDKNGNQRVDPGEVNFSGAPVVYYNWDPNNPNSVKAPTNKLDYNMKTPKTDEFILSAEREVMPAFVLGLAGTYRNYSDFYYAPRMTVDGSRVLTPADYTCTQRGPYPQPDGSPQYVQVCNPTNAGVYGAGTYTTTRPGYTQRYWGIDFSATKRYSDKWMARFNFTYSDWTQHGLAEGQWDPSNRYAGTEQEGGILAPSSTASGAKGFVFLNTKWQGTLSGMYTLPLDFNISTSVYLRQGYPTPYYVVISSTNTPGSTSKNYQLGLVSDQRLPTVFEWDLGLAKVVKVGPTNISLQLDVFNVLNRNTVLQRTTRIYDAAGTATATDSRDNLIYENQSPRIFRVGARITF